MTVRSREAKVFAALLVSMTAGTLVLMALGNNPPSAGAFCLSSYYGLDSVEDVISSRARQSAGRWNRIEVHYSSTKGGNVERLASSAGMANAGDINCHFCLCNGVGGEDGQIQPTERWQKQWSVMPGQSRDSSPQTICICIIGDGKTTVPTDFQIKRLQALIEGLSRKFDIEPESVHYPKGW